MDDGRTISVSSASLIVCVLGLLVCSSASLPVSDIATVAQAPPSSETVSGETVKTGMKVLEKYVNAHLYRVPPLPSLDADQALYKAMYSLSVMQQYVHLIGALNFTSARLDSFAVVMEQVLSDSCEWFNSLNPTNNTSVFPAIDCSDPADFIPTLLALGLRPYVEESSEYLTQRYSSTSNSLTISGWITNTFTDSGDRCQFCTVVRGTALC